MIMEGNYMAVCKRKLRLRICSHLVKIVGVIALIIGDNVNS